MASDSEPTNELWFANNERAQLLARLLRACCRYSWDEGKTWNRVVMGDDKFNVRRSLCFTLWFMCITLALLAQVENIIIEPQAVSQQFIVYGWQTDNTGVLFFIDFAELHERTCMSHSCLHTAELMCAARRWSRRAGHGEQRLRELVAKVCVLCRRSDCSGDS